MWVYNPLGVITLIPASGATNREESPYELELKYPTSGLTKTLRL
jgi:hypothetical protein